MWQCLSLVSVIGKIAFAYLLHMEITGDYKEHFQFRGHYFRSNHMQGNESHTQRKMLIDWAIFMALRDHHYFSVLEENADVKDGKPQSVQSITHLL